MRAYHIKSDGSIEAYGNLLTDSISYEEALDRWEIISPELRDEETLWLGDGIAVKHNGSLERLISHQAIHKMIVDRAATLLQETQAKFPVGNEIYYTTTYWDRWHKDAQVGRVKEIRIESHEVEPIEDILGFILLCPLGLDEELRKFIGITIETAEGETITRTPDKVVDKQGLREYRLERLPEMEKALADLHQEVEQGEQVIKELREILGIEE